MDYFLMIATDGHKYDGTKVPAIGIIRERLRVAKWPIYPGTKNRRALTADARLAFYCAGSYPGAQSVVAHAVAGSVRPPMRNESTNRADLLVNEVFSMIDLKDIHVYNEAVNIRPLVESLGFLGEVKWGAGLAGGCRRISQDDFKILTHSAS